jgi:hypothetical protein
MRLHYIQICPNLPKTNNSSICLGYFIYYVFVLGLFLFKLWYVKALACNSVFKYLLKKKKIKIKNITPPYECNFCTNTFTTPWENLLPKLLPQPLIELMSPDQIDLLQINIYIKK